MYSFLLGSCQSPLVMGLLPANCHVNGIGTHSPWPISAFMGRKLIGLHDKQKILPTKFFCGLGGKIRAFASRNSVKKLRKDRQARKNLTLQTNKIAPNEGNGLEDRFPSEDDSVPDNKKVSPIDNLAAQGSITIPSRGAVLQACTVTSGLIAALGIIIRQVSHTASIEGLPILDCSMEVSFGFEMWHLELIAGLVIMVSSCRFLLLKTWPDFAESSEAANQQVLSSLQPLDYMVVAFLPGISEELLFRGALLPLFGVNWKSVFVVAAIFGVLHLGGGRKYSFAIWATFVGVLYGYATIASSNLIVPMASHAINNLIGGISWRYTSKSLE
ncbi:hypothetical protein CK203_091752 [Vitis vinifera]|uniref:CAAX prenyl protease 2/Lysostaphin resistance protein A-like domain-containing protein n=1 Tax=Vitis vinifera TaxID=29760 RepID=A0A438EJB7_VITVI|nr:hypothetical protein CK203_091752 [Vitis vinifera]